MRKPFRTQNTDGGASDGELQKLLIRKVLLQMLGVTAYLALVVIFYWRGLTHAGAVATIIGLLFFFRTVVSSGAISIGHLSPSDPQSNI
jgi:hypothetical protein